MYASTSVRGTPRTRPHTTGGTTQNAARAARNDARRASCPGPGQSSATNASSRLQPRPAPASPPRVDGSAQEVEVSGPLLIRPTALDSHRVGSGDLLGR